MKFRNYSGCQVPDSEFRVQGWGAHAPSRVSHGASPGDFTRKIGVGANFRTRGRVRSPTSEPWSRRRIGLSIIFVWSLFALAAWAGEKSLPASQPGKISSAQTNTNPHPAPVPVPPGPFDLQICFELAVLRSETLGMKEEDVKVAQARYWQTVGAIFPKVHVITTERVQNRTSGGGGSFNNDPTTGGVSTGGGGGGGRSDQFTSRLNVKQPIFSGFREFNTGAAGKAEIEARKLTKQRALQLLYLDVADVFHQVLMYEADLAILNDVKSALNKRVEELDKRINLGKSRAGEILMAKSDLASNMATIEQARGLLGASRELLAFLTGVPSASLKLKDLAPALPTSEALEGYLKETGERPDLLAAIASERAARRQLSAAKGEHFPTISAEGNYYLRQSPDSKQEWNVFLTCDIPLFEGGIIEARVSEKKALVRSSELNLDLIRRTAEKEVRTEYNNFVAAIARVVCLKESFEVFTENFNVQSRDYKLGIVSNLDVLGALKIQHEARRQLLDAETDARVSMVRLHVAAGQRRP